MSGTIWAQYGEAFVFEVYAAKVADGQMAASGDWTIASGDFKVSKDEGTEGNPTTLPSFVATSDKIKVPLSAAEMTGKEILVKMKDDASVLSDYWRIRTFGHQSASDPRGVFRRGTAQAGAAGTITLDASASAVDDFYNGNEIWLVAGTGALQVRQIIDYNGTTKVATVYVAGPPVQGGQWVTAPDATSVFEIRPLAITPTAVNVTAGVVQASLSTAERQALVTEILDLANTVETGLTVRGSLRLALAALAGKVSGAGTGTEVFRNAVQDSKARLTATVDSSGNRTAITADAG